MAPAAAPECPLGREDHSWPMARRAVLDRDGWQCRRCGRGPGNWTLLRALIPRPRYDTIDQAVLAEWLWFTRVRLEVHHVRPVGGRRRRAGCWHHRAGLVSLCHGCHVGVTAAQRAGAGQPMRLSLAA